MPFFAVTIMQLIEDERQCRVSELRSMRIRLNKQTNNFEFCKKYTQYIHSHIKSYTSLNIYTGQTIGPKEVRFEYCSYEYCSYGTVWSLWIIEVLFTISCQESLEKVKWEIYMDMHEEVGKTIFLLIPTT